MPESWNDAVELVAVWFTRLKGEVVDPGSCGGVQVWPAAAGAPHCTAVNVPGRMLVMLNVYPPNVAKEVPAIGPVAAVMSEMVPVWPNVMPANEPVFGPVLRIVCGLKSSTMPADPASDRSTEPPKLSVLPLTIWACATV